jgi:hypothetical protein
MHTSRIISFPGFSPKRSSFEEPGPSTCDTQQRPPLPPTSENMVDDDRTITPSMFPRVALDPIILDGTQLLSQTQEIPDLIPSHSQSATEKPLPWGRLVSITRNVVHGTRHSVAELCFQFAIVGKSKIIGGL